ncbi:hypothetical protein MBLNU13_g06857t1 [Cladosporium sp. NU13]
MKGDNLSHEEVWDDSALQDSWNDALAEYKKYHSLAAKGEQVDIDELAKNEQTDVHTEPAADDQNPSRSNGVATHSLEQPQTTTGAQAARQSPVTKPFIPATQATPAALPNASAVGGAMPQALLNSVQDEGLKNLMMSWYYAGYYTGLLEGQQKAYASMQEGG